MARIRTRDTHRGYWFLSAPFNTFFPFSVVLIVSRLEFSERNCDHMTDMRMSKTVRRQEELSVVTRTHLMFSPAVHLQNTQMFV